MVKLKSLPNQGTRTIHLPVVGDVAFVNGEVEIPEDKVEELLQQSFGFNLSDPEKQQTTQNNKSENGSDSDDSKIPKLEELKLLRVVDLKEFFDALCERGVVTEEEKIEYEKLKKAERAEFIHSALQREEPKIEEPEEEDKE